jgi:hypothetical protein
VQTSELPNQIGTWPEHQVVSIRKDDLCADISKVVGAHCFHTSGGSHRHESRRLDDAVGGVQPPTSSIAARVPMKELESH